MSKEVRVIKASTDVVYVSSTINNNSDGTYTIQNKFSGSDEEFIVTYPRVKLDIDCTMEIINDSGVTILPFPFKNYEVMPNEKGILFELQQTK